ncbi:MAG: prolyl oligopeptidase family serine peptidase [Longimicrobiales bacterium]
MPSNAPPFRKTLLLLATLLFAITGPGSGNLDAQERQTLTFPDLMKVRQVRSPSISPDGGWVALAAVPDRGDGEVLVYAADGGSSFSIRRGSGPVISDDGGWVAARVEPSFEARETAERGAAPRPGLALLATSSGEILEWEEVQRFAFSADGGWLARLHHAPKEEAEGKEGRESEEEGGQESEEEGGQESEEEGGRVRKDPGTLLVLRNLSSGEEMELSHVKSFSFHPETGWMTYVVAAPDGNGDGIFLQPLETGSEAMSLEAGEFLQVDAATWWEEGEALAWVSAPEDEEGDPESGTVSYWDGGDVREVSLGDALPEGWEVPLDTRLQWSEDGERLFYGSRPARESESGEGEETDEAFDPFDMEKILEAREVDVWHTDDPYINPNQKVMWSRLQRRTHTGVYHLADDRAVQLGDEDLVIQGVPDNPVTALATTDLPYRKESTWTGGSQDIYLVDLNTGDRTLVVEGYRGGGSAASSWIGAYAPSMDLSPGGRFLVWFMEDHWHLHDARTGSTRNLTRGLDVTFFDVDHDFPSPRGGHGIGGWLEDDAAILLHDKFDLWRFPTDGGAPVNLTEGRGRARETILRVLEVDPEVEAFSDNARIHLSSFDWRDKSFGFFATRARRGGLETLLDEEKRVQLVQKAEDEDRLLFTREDYDEFPDLWVADLDFESPSKVTDVNPGLLDRFAWGTSMLVGWTSDDGIPLEGVVILPGNYEEGKRYPVLTYFYRFFSQRLHEFNQPVINHRPSFPIYASDGYIVFLPDVRFEVGRPGLSSLKSVVPGVKKLVEMGLADPEALGLHGHSWSGYTTSYIVTQTDIFAAAVAGAPVSNMTSAYGGIRWGSGLARQFQYEEAQSRLSGSLWEARPDYIENSPLFYTDKIHTPLVIMHGDEDEAVPWYQSIEFYLALRRTGKDAVFLQYRGEPHHPGKYANKLDYSLKMKAFFDHHLKGAPAPDWWAEGVPYRGK